MTSTDGHARPPHILAAVVSVLCGTLALAVVLQSILTSNVTSAAFISSELWQRTIHLLGGRFEPISATELSAGVPYAAVAAPVAVASLVLWIGGGWWIGHRRGISFTRALAAWGTFGWCWWMAAGVWELAVMLAALAGQESATSLLLSTVHLWLAVALAGWLATLCTLSAARPQRTAIPGELADNYRVPAAVWLIVSVYMAVFVTLNWQLYWGLWIPHGDSAMYEEHLWNITHGKGFRSYLDQGLFFGEHVQVIHLMLLPLYVLWPSHLLLELCESLALAACAVPVYWMARRHCGSRRAALLLSAASLLYFPLQFLDIAVDFKTFRPISFGVPLLLLAIDQMERGRYGRMTVLLALTLSAKEDYALVIGPLAAWMLLRQARFQSRWRAAHEGAGTAVGNESRAERHESEPVEPSRAPSAPAEKSAPLREGSASSSNARTDVSASRVRWIGGGLALFSIAYLLLVTRVVIPWFRSGAEVHYARYFSRFGESLTEIAWNMAAGVFTGDLVTPSMIVYAFYLLLPLGFLPLLSPGRLAVGLPLFVLLSLNEIAQDPRHHFHAPIVPILFWAAAAGLGAVFRWAGNRQSAPAGDAAGQQPLRTQSPGGRLSGGRPAAWLPGWLAHFAWCSGLASGLWIGLTPLSVSFWDPGSFYHWQKRYIPGERARTFPEVFALVPQDACVASTDFVHPRFTHHRRSYDYSDYPRAVSGNTTRVPDDTDYIVIDTQHYYSKIKSPAEVRELHEEPDRWELLPDRTGGYFIVLRRKDGAARRGASDN